MDSFVFIFQSSWPQSKPQSHPKSLAAPRWPSMPAVFAPTRPARQSTLRAPILGRCPGRAYVAAGHRKWDLQPISSLTAVDAPMRSRTLAGFFGGWEPHRTSTGLDGGLLVEVGLPRDFPPR